MELALQGFQVLSLALNAPGPVAAARLRGLGANLIKVEPPSGDLLATASPAWYKALHAGQRVICLDLKDGQDRTRMDELLAESDLLLTSSRLSALQRLGLAWEGLHARFPRLCQVAILGYPAPQQERPGHDLTYQAELGLIDPPHLPRTLLADLAGAEWAVSAALALLLERERWGRGVYAEVSLAQAAEAFAVPLRFGLTHPGEPLGGGLPVYNLYRTQDGWIAIAALEARFWQRLADELELNALQLERADLERIFLAQTAEYWEAWGKERDLPITAVKDAQI